MDIKCDSPRGEREKKKHFADYHFTWKVFDLHRVVAYTNFVCSWVTEVHGKIQQATPSVAFESLTFRWATGCIHTHTQREQHKCNCQVWNIQGNCTWQWQSQSAFLFTLLYFVYSALEVQVYQWLKRKRISNSKRALVLSSNWAITLQENLSTSCPSSSWRGCLSSSLSLSLSLSSSLIFSLLSFIDSLSFSSLVLFSFSSLVHFSRTRANQTY